MNDFNHLFNLINNNLIEIPKTKIKNHEKKWGKRSIKFTDDKYLYAPFEKIGEVSEFTKINLKAYDYKNEYVVIDKIKVKTGIYKLFF